MRWTKLRQTCKEIGRRWERFTSNYMAFHTYPSHTLYTQKNIYRIRHRQCLCSVHAPDTTNTNWSTQSQLKIIRALFILVSTAEFIFRFIAWYSRLHAVASPSMEPREIINIFMEKKNAIRKRQIRIKKRAHLEQIVIIILNLSKKKSQQKKRRLTRRQRYKKQTSRREKIQYMECELKPFSDNRQVVMHWSSFPRILSATLNSIWFVWLLLLL